MKTSVTVPLKTFICSAIAIIFFVVMLCYYNTSNIAIPIKNIQSEINALLDKSIDSFNETYNEEAKQINVDLNNNKYTKGEIANWFQKDFVTSWRIQKKLDTTYINTNRIKSEKLFKGISSKISWIQNNQLLCCFIIPSIFTLFLFLAAFTNLLRDIIGDPTKINQAIANLESETEKKDVMPPFSLSRTQIAVWITIISSFYIHAVFWNQCPKDILINSTALILMGISAGTLATGVIIDTIEIDQNVPRNQDEPGSGFFFKDILSDKNGISIQRFQNVVWTIIAIIIYIYRYNNNTSLSCLPDLDSTLLALTGISSATYLTLKTRENTPSQSAVTPAK